MRVIKPPCVQMDSKSNFPVYCVDINPDCTTLAMGGLGDTSGRIKLWAIHFLIGNEGGLTEENLICQLDNITKCVNCLRWSHSGRYLASGDDQSHLKIWRHSKTNNSWQVHRLLFGHKGDILDLNWSSGDRWLATASVDNSVIIWDAVQWSGQVCVLKGHTGFVKGVSWDPLGHYIASQCDDRSVRIWSTSTWREITCIEKPFNDCYSNTHALRLSWFANGRQFISPNSMNNNAPTAQFIDRDSWAIKHDIVGHRKAISVVSANPFMFSIDGFEEVTYFVIGSRDRSLSFWQTGLQRPLFVIHDLFANSISDISWNPSGYQFVCSSIDGSIAFFMFEKEEFGQSLVKPTSVEPIITPKLTARKINSNNISKISSDRVPSKDSRRRIPLTFLGSFDSDDDIIQRENKNPLNDNCSNQSENKIKISRTNGKQINNVIPCIDNLTPLRIVPSIRDIFHLTTSLSGSHFTFEAVNDQSFSLKDFRYYSCHLRNSSNQVLWQSFTTSPCIGASMSSLITAVLCQDSTLFVFITASGNLISIIPLTFQAYAVYCIGDIMVAISTQLAFTAWTIMKKQCLVRDISLPYDMLNESTVNIINIGIIHNDIFISLTNGKCYLFSFSMTSWLSIQLQSDQINLCSNMEAQSRLDLVRDNINSHIPIFDAEHLFLKILSDSSLNSFIKSWNNLVTILTDAGDEGRLRCLIMAFLRKDYFYYQISFIDYLTPAKFIDDTLSIIHSNPKLDLFHNYLIRIVSTHL